MTNKRGRRTNLCDKKLLREFGAVIMLDKVNVRDLN